MIFLALLLLTACSDPQQLPQELVLYDGHSFAGWTLLGGSRAFMIEGEGVLAYGDAAGALVTERTFGDFTLSCDIRSDAMSAAGIALRCGADPRGVEGGVVVALADRDAAHAGKDACGGIRGVAEARSAAMEPTGTWNRLEIRMHGSEVSVRVNGVATASAVVKAPESGRIALLGGGEFFWVRDLRLKPL